MKLDFMSTLQISLMWLAVLVTLVITVWVDESLAFTVISSPDSSPKISSPPLSISNERSFQRRQLLSAKKDDIEDEFASFAASLVDNNVDDVATQKKNNNGESKATTTRKKILTSVKKQKKQEWQADLEQLLLDPTLSVSQRQSVLANLINANEEIRESVLTAVRDRNIDPLLTPTQRKLQDGTRAVARQVTNDILPSLAKTVTRNPTPMPPNPVVVGSSLAAATSRIGNQVFRALETQFRQNMETLSGDLMNPARIPQRISQQTEDFLKEAQNIFSETPVGLNEPKYTVVYSTDAYEVRDYEEYTVASTDMVSNLDGENNDETKTTDIWSLTEQGAAFNTLASYIFGANEQKLVMEMTTPVTTTMFGEMRFYIDMNSPPKPLVNDKQDSNKNYGSSSSSDSSSKINIRTIPAARLAVRKFTGFVTAGEISRQKNALLTAIAFDSDKIELDVPHGSTVGHVIFQYNPPYTLPIVRRNEIAVPVNLVEEQEETITKEPVTFIKDAWQVETGEENYPIKENKVNGLHGEKEMVSATTGSSE